jgi:uncharacterized protein YbbC (DUF1343 family)
MSFAFSLGINTLINKHQAWLKKTKIGILTHLPAVSMQGMTSAELLKKHSAVNVTAIYSPEHGFTTNADAGKTVNELKQFLGIPVYTLYRQNKRLIKNLFAKCDVILIDLQDLAARPYTYGSTLCITLEICEELKKPVIIADRPVALPNTIDGPLLQKAFKSFVGYINTPMHYGMTPGETALWLKNDLKLDIDIKIAKMQSYHRQEWNTNKMQPWTAPSPAITSVESAKCYLATIFSEAIPCISNGSKTNLAYQLVGAEWLDPGKLRMQLNQLKLPGVSFYFYPFENCATKRIINGLRLIVDNTNEFKPILTNISVLWAIQQISTQGKDYIWKASNTNLTFFDKLYGTDAIRKSLIKGKHPFEISEMWKQDIEEFRQTRKKVLLYNSTPGVA